MELILAVLLIAAAVGAIGGGYYLDNRSHTHRDLKPQPKDTVRPSAQAR